MLKRRGFTLIEILIYVALLAVLVAAIVQVIPTLGKSARALRSERRLANAADLAIESLIRDIRQASEIITSSSSFGVNPGVLVLRLPQAPGSQTIVSRTFSLSSSRLQRQDDLGLTEFLTPPEVLLSNLVFWHKSATTSEIITIQITLDSENFYGSAVLRSKY